MFCLNSPRMIQFRGRFSSEGEGPGTQWSSEAQLLYIPYCVCHAFARGCPAVRSFKTKSPCSVHPNCLAFKLKLEPYNLPSFACLLVSDELAELRT